MIKELVQFAKAAATQAFRLALNDRHRLQVWCADNLKSGLGESKLKEPNNIF